MFEPIKTSELTKDAVSLLIPVVTAFIGLFGGTLAYLWKQQTPTSTNSVSGNLEQPSCSGSLC